MKLFGGSVKQDWTLRQVYLLTKAYKMLKHQQQVKVQGTGLCMGTDKSLS